MKLSVEQTSNLLSQPSDLCPAGWLLAGLPPGIPPQTARRDDIQVCSCCVFRPVSPGSQIPGITEVLAKSPAAAAGILDNDILVKAGAYPIARYPDAVNALFYSVPGETTSLHILRNNQCTECKVTPIAK